MITPDKITVLIGGIVLIIFILWFFLGPKDKSEAKISNQTGKSKQEVVIVVEGSYSPTEVIVKKEVPVEITFDRRESGDCSEWVIFEQGKWQGENGRIEREIKAKLAPFAKTKIEFTPMEVGEFPFSCGMGMLHGKLIVKE